MMENDMSRRKVLRLTLAAVSLGLLGVAFAKERGDGLPERLTAVFAEMLQDGTIVVARGDKIVASKDESLVGSSIETVPTLAGHPCAGPSGCQDRPHPRDDGQRLCGGPPESSCGGHDRTSDQAAGPGQRLPDAGEVLPESGMNLPPDFTTLPKHDKVKILCPSSKKDTSGGGESRRESTQHDTASQPRTERMLLQWNRAKRPLI